MSVGRVYRFTNEELREMFPDCTPAEAAGRLKALLRRGSINGRSAQAFERALAPVVPQRKRIDEKKPTVRQRSFWHKTPAISNIFDLGAAQ